MSERAFRRSKSEGHGGSSTEEKALGIQTTPPGDLAPARALAQAAAKGDKSQSPDRGTLATVIPPQEVDDAFLAQTQSVIICEHYAYATCEQTNQPES